MDKDALVLEYTSIAKQYAAAISGNDPIDANKKDAAKKRMNEIRDLLGMNDYKGGKNER